VLLLLGAEGLVRGSIRLAHRLGVSSLIVGLTVVALGTSFPELFVSVIAAARGEPGVALGNVVGSNIFNIAVILALAALIRPVQIELRLLRLEIPFVLLITLLTTALALDGAIGRVDGGLLLAGFAAYMFSLRRTVRLEGARKATARPGTAAAAAGGTLWAPVLMAAVGLVVLLYGAHWLVDSATRIALNLGVSERVIGLTLVSGGTSLPELAATLVATARRESDLAVGNLLGSNIFNMLGILGASALTRPLGPSGPFLRLDLPAAILVALLLLPLARTGWRLSRWEGGLLFALYGVYLWLVFAGAGGA
jgi:cation:H+ antiporter